MAESLLDYKPPQRNMHAARIGGEKNAPRKFEDPRKDKPWFDNQFRRDPPKSPRKSCFICDGPHWTRECPNQKAMNALVAETVNKNEGEASIQEELGAMRHLVALTKLLSKEEHEEKGLQFVELSINGKESVALVDTRASHNFLDMKEAERLGV